MKAAWVASQPFQNITGCSCPGELDSTIELARAAESWNTTSMFPASRITDFHMCPMITPGVPPIPHVGGPILPPCAVTVLTGCLPQARVTDMALCVGPPDVIVKGSTTVLVNCLPLARIMDNTAHGGMIMLGEFTVLVGG